MGGTGWCWGLALSPVLTLFPFKCTQPSAPNLVLMEVSALDRTSASVPQVGEGNTATWVSRQVAPQWGRVLGSPHPPWRPAPFSPLCFLVTRRR